MPPAARVGDKTSHATTPLGPGMGSPDVNIGGIPAWRAKADFHKCPLYSGTAHVGGVVTVGSASVRINGFPAVRKGDEITESGFTNYIITGCETVLIG